MTTFSIEKFLKGQPVMTRSGLKVETLREIGYPENKDRLLTALLNSVPRVWDMSGKYISGNDTAMDLFMDEPVVYYWVPTKEILDVDPQSEDYTQIQIIETRNRSKKDAAKIMMIQGKDVEVIE